MRILKTHVFLLTIFHAYPKKHVLDVSVLSDFSKIIEKEGFLFKLEQEISNYRIDIDNFKNILKIRANCNSLYLSIRISKNMQYGSRLKGLD